MNIHAKKGDKVIFIHSTYGNSLDQELGGSLLKLYQVYTVDYTKVYDYNTIVYLQEFPGKPFNSVLFEDQLLDKGANVNL